MKKYLQEIVLDKEFVEYLDEVPLWSAPFGLKLLEKINYRKGNSAIDIGFGAGFPLIELAMRLGESSIVYGVDPWPDAVSKTKDKIDYYQLNNIIIIEGQAESIPIEDGSIDLVVSNNGFNNVRDLNQSLKECCRISKSGAQLVMTMNLDKTMIEFYSVFEQVLGQFGLKDSKQKLLEHIHEKRRPIQEVLDMLGQNGFEVIETDYDSFKYRFADGTALLNHHFIRAAFMDSWKKLVPGELLDDVFTCTEVLLNTYSSTTVSTCLSIPFVTIDAIKA